MWLLFVRPEMVWPPHSTLVLVHARSRETTNRSYIPFNRRIAEKRENEVNRSSVSSHLLVQTGAGAFTNNNHDSWFHEIVTTVANKREKNAVHSTRVQIIRKKHRVEFKEDSKSFTISVQLWITLRNTECCNFNAPPHLQESFRLMRTNYY